MDAVQCTFTELLKGMFWAASSLAAVVMAWEAHTRAPALLLQRSEMLCSPPGFCRVTITLLFCLSVGITQMKKSIVYTNTSEIHAINFIHNVSLEQLNRMAVQLAQKYKDFCVCVQNSFNFSFQLDL